MKDFAKVLKYNAHGINQYTKGNGGVSFASLAKLSGSVSGGSGAVARMAPAQKDDLTSASIVGFTRQEQAKTFITAL